MAKKILKIVLIVAFSIVGLPISMNPIFIIFAVIAIVTTLKQKETAESPAGKKYMGAMDEFETMMESLVKKPKQPQTEYSDKYETKQSGFFTVKVPKQPQTDSKPKAEPNPHYTEEQAKRLLRYIHDSTAKDTVRIKPMPADSTLPFEKKVCSSKFGGLPYWTRGEEYPKAQDGANLYLLAQINFSEVPNLADYPNRGLLQIFIKADDTYGCSFDSEQKDWRIVWREVFSPSLAMSEGELREMGVYCTGEQKSELPLQKEYALSFEKTQTFSHPLLDDFDSVLKNAVQVLGFSVYDKGPYELFDEDSFNAFFDDNAKHQIGGYPDFTQNDARRKGDILLFQMASEWIATGGDDDDDRKNAIMWGDMGIANFFINPEDLINRDFSNVLYNWDCY